MIDLFEKLFPRVANGLYSQGFTRELVENSLNGIVPSAAILAILIALLIVFRKRIIALTDHVGENKFFTACLIVLSCLSLPDPVFPMRPGLDYSWQWMLNKLAFSREWGTSIVFTYGPLGWLLYPSERLATILCALLANICHYVLWIWSLRKIHSESENGRAMAWGLLLTMFFPQMTMEWRWIALAVVLTRVSWVAAGIVSALLSMMKFSSIVMAMGTQVFILACDNRRKVLPYVIGFTSMFILLASFSFASPEAFWTWLIGSIQIASGYNQHMLFEKSALELSVPVIAFFAVVHSPRVFLAAIPLVPILYCSAKYAWIRQNFLPFLYLLMILSAFIMERFVPLRRRLAVTSCLFVLVGFAVLWPWHFASGMTYVAFPYGINPTGALKSFIVPYEMASAETRAKELLHGSELPDNIRKGIGNQRVQLLGHEFAPAMVDKTLNLAPYATMQLYSTYTEILDKMAARSYSMPDAPAFVLVDTANLSLDSKNPFLDSPRTWAALRRYYAIDFTAENDRWILLKRRKVPIGVSLTKTINVSESSLIEKVVSLLFRGRFYYAEVESINGEMQRFRVNPLVLKDPVDRDLPLDTKELVGYFKKK